MRLWKDLKIIFPKSPPRDSIDTPKYLPAGRRNTEKPHPHTTSLRTACGHPSNDSELRKLPATNRNGIITVMREYEAH